MSAITASDATYANGLVRPSAMAQLPDWALREFLYRHSGPALEAAQDEATHRGWERVPQPTRRAGAFYCRHCGTDEAMPGHEC